MKPPSHTDPNNHADNPFDFATKHSWDVYPNPWWALRFLNGPAEKLADALTAELGRPELFWQGSFYALKWQERNVSPWPWETTPHGSRRPWFCCNISGGNGSVWTHFYLPWCPYITIQDVQYPNQAHTLGNRSLRWHLEQLYIYSGAPSVLPDQSEKFEMGLDKYYKIAELDRSAIDSYFWTLLSAYGRSKEVANNEAEWRYTDNKLGNALDVLGESIANQRWPFPPWDGPEDMSAPTLKEIVMVLDDVKNSQRPHFTVKEKIGPGVLNAKGLV